MDIRIEPSPLSGHIGAVASKSDAHRLLICAALADAPTKIALPQAGDDIEATMGCLRAMGAKIEYSGGICTVEPIKKPAERPCLDCGESGSTLRFLLPVVSAVCGGGKFSGRGRLPERPLGELAEAMKRGGVSFSSDTLPLETDGRLQSGDYTMAGNVSSQYVSGLLMALPLVDGVSRVIPAGKLESAAYVDMTLEALRRFGVVIREENGAFVIPGAQTYRSPGKAKVSGDWSNAAFFLVAGALGQGVAVMGLEPDSVQGDAAAAGILRSFGADTDILPDGAVRAGPGKLAGRVVDVSGIPDLLPILSVLAAFSGGETRFTNAARLRLKESDRLKATAAMLHALGGNVEEKSDGLVVRGGAKMRGGMADSFGDHRIAMAAAVAAAYCENATVIKNAEAVRKSYPAFFDDFAKLGGKYEQI